jgi:hypothetical protein
MAIEPGAQFFHGTNVDLPEGTIIEPRRRGAAWATDDSVWADVFARDAVSINKSGEPKVYTVSPVDESDVETHRYPNRNAYSSKSGFRITGEHKDD